MKKQAVLYVLCLTALLLLSGCAAPEAASADMPQSVPRESLCLSDEEMRHIAEAFPAEIAYVESAAPVQMQSLSAAELETVQGIAIQQLYNENYDFSGLMDAIILARETKNAADAAAQSGWSAIQNQTFEILQPYGPLMARHITNVGANGFDSPDFSFEIPAGTAMHGAGIALPFSLDTAQTFTGPTSYEMLPIGYYATHYAVIGVLHGAIVHTEYDLVTAAETVHVAYHYISTEGADITDYALPAVIDTPTYVQAASSDMVREYANQNLFYEAVEADPGLFIG